jgi:hypothetical protein
MRAALAAVALAGCTHTSPGARNVYELSSPDIGVPWHLHAKGGELVCELPCDAPVAENSGTYLVVHDPKKVWRVDLPTSLPGGDGSHVEMRPHIGKGSPALGAFGTVVALVGATIAFTGIAMAVVNAPTFFSGCSDQAAVLCSRTATDAIEVTGLVMTGVGAVLGAGGFYLMERNRPATAHVRVTPIGISGSF